MTARTTPSIPRRTLVNEYHIPRLSRNLTVDADWGKMPWPEIPSLFINQVAGEQPAHLPTVQAKLAYDTAALYVIFQVSDRYVRAVAEHYQDQVYLDSCVELFFTPGEEINQGYFNLEVNCGGTALFHHQKGRNLDDLPVSKADFEQITIAHTLPKIVNPEIAEAITWVVEYRLPFAILSAYTPTNTPNPTVRWRANLYKCADECSHPHWLTWSPVTTPAPDFHRPEFFGVLIFD